MRSQAAPPGQGPGEGLLRRVLRELAITREQVDGAAHADELLLVEGPEPGMDGHTDPRINPPSQEEAVRLTSLSETGSAREARFRSPVPDTVATGLAAAAARSPRPRARRKRRSA